MGWWSSHEILWFFIHKENMEPEINARKKAECAEVQISRISMGSEPSVGAL